MEYDNTNSGAIFKNNRKEKETHPDLGGVLNVEGKEYYVNAWKKTSKAGAPFYSLSIKAKEANGTKGASKDTLSDEEPF